MQQRRFWGKNRDWVQPRKRPRKIEFNAAKGIYEVTALEEDVIKEIMPSLWHSGIPVCREKERRPCPRCKTFSGEPSDPGHPDLYGWIPAHKAFPKNIRSLGSIPFYIEVKRPRGGVASEAQKEFIRRARRDGVLAFFAVSWLDVWINFWAIGIELIAGPPCAIADIFNASIPTKTNAAINVNAKATGAERLSERKRETGNDLA